MTTRRAWVYRVQLGVALTAIGGCANTNTTRAVGIGLMAAGGVAPLVQTATVGHSVKDVPNASTSWEAVGIGWGVGAAVAIAGSIIYAIGVRDAKLDPNEKQRKPEKRTEPLAGYWVPVGQCRGDVCGQCPNWETEASCTRAEGPCRVVAGVRPACPARPAPPTSRSATN